MPRHLVPLRAGDRPRSRGDAVSGLAERRSLLVVRDRTGGLPASGRTRLDNRCADSTLYPHTYAQSGYPMLGRIRDAVTAYLYGPWAVLQREKMLLRELVAEVDDALERLGTMQARLAKRDRRAALNGSVSRDLAATDPEAPASPPPATPVSPSTEGKRAAQRRVFLARVGGTTPGGAQ